MRIMRKRTQITGTPNGYAVVADSPEKAMSAMRRVHRRTTGRIRRQMHGRFFMYHDPSEKELDDIMAKAASVAAARNRRAEDQLFKEIEQLCLQGPESR